MAAFTATVFLTTSFGDSGHGGIIHSPNANDFAATFFVGAICTFAFILVNRIKVKVDFLTVSIFLALISVIFSLVFKYDQGFLAGFSLFLLTGFIYALSTNAFRSNFIIRYFVGSFTYFFLKIKAIWRYVSEANIHDSAKKVRIDPKDIVVTGLLFIVLGIPLILVVLGLLASVNPNFANFISWDFVGKFIFFSITFIYFASELYLLKTLPHEKKILTNAKVRYDIDSAKLLLRVVFLILIVLNIFYTFFIGADFAGEIMNVKAHFNATSYSSYSEYSVSRFWALIQVTLINLFLIYIVSKPLKKLSEANSHFLRPALKFNLGLMIVLTFGLIFSTLARFGLYIQGYGLTEDRIYGITFPILIGAILILFAYGAFTKKHSKFHLTSFALLILYFACMHIIPFNYVSAKANYELYKAGAIKVFNAEEILQNPGIQYYGNNPIGDETLIQKCGSKVPDGALPYPTSFTDSQSEKYLIAIDIVKENNSKLPKEKLNCMKQTLLAITQDLESHPNRSYDNNESWNIMTELAKAKLLANKRYFE